MRQEVLDNKKKESLERGNGVIMPIFSLPSNYGVGTLGKEAYEFVDFLSDAGIKYWQILPLGPTTYGDSPYQSFSSFAGNPYFVDLEVLIEDGLLEQEDLANVEFAENDQYVDYAQLYNKRFRILEKAFSNVDSKLEKEIAKFRKKEKFWIEDYASFMAIKEDNLDVSWLDFPEELKLHDKKALSEFNEKHKERIDFFVFIQYEFFKQWDKLREYTNRHRIQIIGDIPIYVALDSADAWANTDILKLDDNKDPLFVGGCPPDDFSDDGQLWGNPVYDWDKLKKDDFKFWIKRLEVNKRLFDIIRLDHFRGFEAYYEINFEDDTAKYGNWVKAKPYEFFDCVKDKLSDIKFILEDLGFITDEVKELKEYLNFPGMKVIQFAFSEDMQSEYLPYNYTRNSVCYSSTHDQDTLKGWFDNLEEDDLERVTNYFNLKEDESYNWGVIRGLMASVSDIAMFQMQDFLELGNEARINRPSTLGENWKWRIDKDDLTEELSTKIKEMAKLYGRYQ
ncbi:MAG: 4-alpha-glucanotransferase [Tissierellia bacterium]|nr:4-alpha-glucanotransferase [Tissierellia bacterium]